MHCGTGLLQHKGEEANVIAQLSTVYDKYRANIFCGLFEDDVWENYIAELKTAGVDEYIGAYQDQLNAWKAQ